MKNVISRGFDEEPTRRSIENIRLPFIRSTWWWKVDNEGFEIFRTIILSINDFFSSNCIEYVGNSNNDDFDIEKYRFTTMSKRNQSPRIVKVFCSINKLFCFTLNSTKKFLFESIRLQLFSIQLFYRQLIQYTIKGRQFSVK